eukprot:comp20785_c0_seq1/m.27302 comp20785_c0_seq1/g.27302  ORF comp20785_c0_seq1/g.27302 comp20785_c0_seq1/m.27302 type:complete len:996 (-) comp20785_c0_seq1:153-3140(-)
MAYTPGRGLGVETFVATPHGIEECGANGLPLTPHSINIIGRFQRLKTLRHDYLCQYVDISKEQHERVYVVSEHHPTSLEDELSKDTPHSEVTLATWAAQILDALAYLNDQGLVHRNLSPSSVLLSQTGAVKLSRYGLFHMTDSGAEVSFPIGVPRYMSPDLLVSSPEGDSAKASSCANFKLDTWAVGLILLELHLGGHVWPHLDDDLQALFYRILSLCRLPGQQSQPLLSVSPTTRPITRWGPADTRDANPLRRNHSGQRVEYVTPTSPHTELSLTSPSPSNGLSYMEEARSRQRGLVQRSALDDILNAHVDYHDTDAARSGNSQKPPLSPEFRDFLTQCLMVRAVDRPIPQQLLSHPFLHKSEPPKLHLIGWKSEIGSADTSETDWEDGEMGPNGEQPRLIDLMPLADVYYFWRLLGKDVQVELARMHVTHTNPPITQIPLLVRYADSVPIARSDHVDRWHLYNPAITPLSLDYLNERLIRAASSPYSKSGYTFLNEQDLREMGETEEAINSMVPPLFNNGKPADQPLAIRERDIDYQYHRILLFRKLLRGYPYTRPAILREARIDIPPAFRGEVWAALLGIDGDVDEIYGPIDKTSEHPIDRQIDVDIPRCHQYDLLLSSPAGHAKLRRLLKAWVTANPRLVYWQGLDSVAAPFLWLNFTNESIAFACLDRFVKMYLNDFFLADNSTVIQEYLAVYRHLLAFHDPELAHHLDTIAFLPELYAIPWFLTVYTHAFPLEKIMAIWDTVLVGSSALPLCIALAILLQFRATLLAMDFNACILLFSDMPQVNLDNCLKRARTLWRDTPPSIAWRRHDAWDLFDERIRNGDPDPPVHTIPSDEPSSETHWYEAPVPLDILREEKVPRIPLEDVLHMSQCLVVDIRDDDKFLLGHWKGSLHIPYRSLRDMLDLMLPFKGGNVVVMASRGTSGAKFGWRLVKRQYPKVSVLHGGVDAVRAHIRGVSLLCVCEGTTISASPSIENKAPPPPKQCVHLGRQW